MMATTCNRGGELPVRISVKQAADVLNTHPVTVRRLVRDGLLQGRKVRNRFFITAEALRAFLGSTQA